MRQKLVEFPYLTPWDNFCDRECERFASEGEENKDNEDAKQKDSVCGSQQVRDNECHMCVCLCDIQGTTKRRINVVG